jgi:hypothetical protein
LVKGVRVRVPHACFTHLRGKRNPLARGLSFFFAI